MIQDTAWSPRFVPSTTATAATSGEAIAGTDTTKFITPSLLPAATSYHAGPVVNGRAPRQGLVFDGSSTAVVSASGVPAFGSGDFTVSIIVRPDEANVPLFSNAIGSSFSMFLATNAINIQLHSVADGPSFPFTASIGKFYHIVYVKSSGQGYAYVNGVSLGASQSDSFTYGQPVTQIGSDVDFKKKCVVVSPLIYNRALSASEVVALYEAGAPSGADYNSASNTAINSSAFTNFNYDTFSGASATGFTAVNTSGATEYAQGNPVSITGLKYGNVIRVTYSLTLNSGQLPQVALGNIGTETHSAFYFLTAGSNQTVDIVVSTNSGTSTNIAFRSTAASNYAISSVSARRIGLLLAPDAAQAGNNCLWTDLSGNGSHILLPASGVSWNVPSTGQTRIRATTSTNGNQKLLGSVITLANTYIVRVRGRSRSGTPTVNLSTYSNGQDIVANVALSTTWKTLTIISGAEINPGTFWWAGSNSTDIVEWDIALEPLSY